jgi:hypothetical protein
MMNATDSGAMGKRYQQCALSFLELDSRLTGVVIGLQHCVCWIRHRRLRSSVYALDCERPQPYSTISSMSGEMWVITSKWTPKFIPHNTCRFSDSRQIVNLYVSV